MNPVCTGGGFPPFPPQGVGTPPPLPPKEHRYVMVGGGPKPADRRGSSSSSSSSSSLPLLEAGGQSTSMISLTPSETHSEDKFEKLEQAMSHAKRCAWLYGTSSSLEIDMALRAGKSLLGAEALLGSPHCPCSSSSSFSLSPSPTSSTGSSEFNDSCDADSLCGVEQMHQASVAARCLNYEGQKIKARKNRQRKIHCKQLKIFVAVMCSIMALVGVVYAIYRLSRNRAVGAGDASPSFPPPTMLSPATPSPVSTTTTSTTGAVTRASTSVVTKSTHRTTRGTTAKIIKSTTTKGVTKASTAELPKTQANTTDSPMTQANTTALPKMQANTTFLTTPTCMPVTTMSASSSSQALNSTSDPSGAIPKTTLGKPKPAKPTKAPKVKPTPKVKPICEDYKQCWKQGREMKSLGDVRRLQLAYKLNPSYVQAMVEMDTGFNLRAEAFVNSLPTELDDASMTQLYRGSVNFLYRLCSGGAKARIGKYMADRGWLR